MTKMHTGTRIFLAIWRPIQRLPLGFHYFWGSVFAWIAEHLLHYRRDVIVTNLSRCFPEKKYKELRKLTHEAYTHIGEIFAEAMWFGGNYGHKGRAHDQHIVEITNAKEVFDAFETNNNVMVFNTHFGNWELTGGFFEYIYDIPREQMPISENNICVVYKEMKSTFWDEFFFANRCACQDDDYDGYLESKKILRYAVEHKADKRMYIFPTDQYPYRGAASCDIPSFMGQPTKSMIGGAALAHKMGMPIFHMSINRVQKGKYQLSFSEICPDASQLEVQQIMQTYCSLLEQDIRNNPSNYLWTHKRWK